MQWDSAITLAFAAEHLFAAAQLLTSDLVPWNRALSAAYERHLIPLIENDGLLPEDIRARLVNAQRSYVGAKSGELTREFAKHLASEFMSILSEIAALLHRSSGLSLAGLNQQAA